MTTASYPTVSLDIMRDERCATVAVPVFSVYRGRDGGYVGNGGVVYTDDPSFVDMADEGQVVCADEGFPFACGAGVVLTREEREQVELDALANP